MCTFSVAEILYFFKEKSIIADNMFLKLQPLIYSLFFLAGLELIVFFHAHVLAIVFLLLLMALFQGKKVGKRWKFSILPIFFVISSVALLYFITIRYEQQAFIILVSFMYYLALLGAYRLSKYSGDQTAIGINKAVTIATIFFVYASAYGLYLNFLVPLYFLILTYLLATFFVSYQYFSIIGPRAETLVDEDEEKDEAEELKNDPNVGAKPYDKKIVWAYSLLISLAMTEIAWTMNFWPFGYLTSGAIALILYFVLWDIIRDYFLNILSKKRVLTNLIISLFLVTLVLLSSKWIPVI